MVVNMNERLKNVAKIIAKSIGWIGIYLFLFCETLGIICKDNPPDLSKLAITSLIILFCFKE